MQKFAIGITVFILTGCVTPVKEESGKFIKTVQAEIRSGFGTNQSFARLQRCDGPEKEPWFFYLDKDLTGCKFLTKADQDEWEHASSRGAGPEIVGGLLVGAGAGAGLAASRGASAAAGASTTAVQTVTGGHHHRR